MSTPEFHPDPAARAHAELERVRTRTLGLVDEMTDSHLRRQWLPILSPMVWDLAHIGNYEDLWLVQALAGQRVTPDGLDDLYDAFKQPRDGRERLPLLGPDDARAYIASVRSRVHRALDAGLLDPTRAAGEQRLLRDDFVVGLVVQHEHQHDETILQARQAMGTVATSLAISRTQPSEPDVSTDDATRTVWLHHPGGTGTIGTSTDPWAYDNERPQHDVTLAPFSIARDAVTNAQWLAFVDAGGYDTPSLWHPNGWRWRCDEHASAPLYWRREDDHTWSVLRFGTRIDLDPAAPVQHVSFWEAEAFARFHDARLPTEFEWEAAARWKLPDALDTTTSRNINVGANIGQAHDGPVSPGRLDNDGGVSPFGARGMLGGVWEWTASEFAPYPGFEIFPYAEYSSVFFHRGYRVLRGGSWATDPLVARPTFRNWDHPQRRQLFCGLRIARSKST